MFRNSLKALLSGGKSNRKNRNSSGGSTDGECVFEGDYAVPPLPVTEGMQHIRIMEGVSRSLPSSPLLSHQAINMRLQPIKRLPAVTHFLSSCSNLHLCYLSRVEEKSRAYFPSSDLWKKQ
ncbi:protein TANC2-like [Hoplias malabaricus]|uniref:protein TANC2-like n=1 Tax=Hoplias malabaricus TaxID=27720 RepID=UPI003462EB16